VVFTALGSALHMNAMPRPRSTVSTAVVPGQAAARIADSHDHQCLAIKSDA